MPRYQVRGKVKEVRGGRITVKDHVFTEIDGATAEEAGRKARRLWPHLDFELIRVPEPKAVAS